MAITIMETNVFSFGVFFFVFKFGRVEQSTNRKYGRRQQKMNEEATRSGNRLAPHS